MTGTKSTVAWRPSRWTMASASAPFCVTLKAYGVSTVVGDRYAGEWPRERFRELGVTYDLAASPRSDLYRDLLPGLNSGSVELLDQATLVSQLVGLERRVARGGRESIDHAPNGHDDVANAVAGVVSLIGVRPVEPFAWNINGRTIRAGDELAADEPAPTSEDTPSLILATFAERHGWH